MRFCYGDERNAVIVCRLQSRSAMLKDEMPFETVLGSSFDGNGRNTDIVL